MYPVHISGVQDAWTQLDWELVREALTVNETENMSIPTAWICNCFDSLLIHFGEIQNAVDTGYVLFDDILPPLYYYVNRLYHGAERMGTITAYANATGAFDAKALMDRIKDPEGEAPAIMRRIQQRQAARANN